MEGYRYSHHNYKYGRVWAVCETSCLFTCITEEEWTPTEERSQMIHGCCNQLELVFVSWTPVLCQSLTCQWCKFSRFSFLLFSLPQGGNSRNPLGNSDTYFVARYKFVFKGEEVQEEQYLKLPSLLAQRPGTYQKLLLEKHTTPNTAATPWFP